MSESENPGIPKGHRVSTSEDTCNCAMCASHLNGRDAYRAFYNPEIDRQPGDTISALVGALERLLDTDGIEVDAKGWVTARTEARAALKMARGESS